MDETRMDKIKTPKVERVLLRQFHQYRDFVTGTLCLTDRHLIFIEPSGAQESWVLYHHICSVERLALTTKGYPLIIDTKTFQRLHLIIPRESDCIDIMGTIKLFAQPENYSDLFAYQYKPKDSITIKQSSGWALFDTQSEYGRMGVPNKYWRSTNLNSNYELCETYSSNLYVPASVDDSVILGSAKFRSKGRIPALSYFYAPTQSSLCRSSQPLAGLGGRSVEDEQLIQAIIDVNPTSVILNVVDTRPKINAMANKAAGRGYESTDNYCNVHYEFYNIHNIHVMRESLQKLIEASCSHSQTMSGLLSGLENSGWIKHIHLILSVAVYATKSISQDKISVLVHCSDGWDRTAQTCALTCILLDPYYRSLHGFMVLIEREWLAFGHKLSIRSGHLSGENRETSPIMTQFLDCVWQVMVQFPTAFQFNEFFLVTIHDHLYSCQFGTFLGNYEKERIDMGFCKDTYSLWGHVWSHLDDFINPLFTPHDSVILPNIAIPHLRFWTGLYCRHSLKHKVCELSDEVIGSLSQQNVCLTEHIKFLQQNIVELKETLSRYEDKLGPLDQVSEIRQVPECSQPQVSNNCESPNHRNHLKTVSSNSSTLDVEGDQPQHMIERSVNKEISVLGTQPVEQSAETMSQNLLGHDKPKLVQDSATAVDLTNSQESSSDVVREVSKTECMQPASLIQTSKESSSGTSPKELIVNIPASISALQLDETPDNLVSPESKVVDPSGCLSPNSYSVFKDFLNHNPDMNLPWQPLRSTKQCSCGTAFSYSCKKYHCSYCGVVVCGNCNSYQVLPWQTSSKPQRVCKVCAKLMKQCFQDRQFELDRSY